MPASSQRSMPPPAVPLEEDVSTVSGSDDETQMTDNNEPPPSQPSPSQPSTQRQRASKKRTSRAPRTDIKNRFSRPRWTEDQIEYLLESYAAKRASGELENEKSPLMKMIYARLAEELTDLYPPCVFDIKKVSRKLGDLLRNWKAFCAMERDTSGSGYDRVTGFFHTTDENWKKWEQKHAAGAKAIRNHGLKPIDLYYRAFGGNQEVGLTAVEATDPESLRTLRDDEEDPAADEILVQNSQMSAYEAAQARSPTSSQSQVRFRGVTTTPAPSSSSPPRGRPSRSVESPPQRERRPHRQDSQGGFSRIETAVSALVTGREKGRRPVGADDTQRALQDVQERFFRRAEEEELETFFEWVAGEGMRAVYYNSLNEIFKERLFLAKSGCLRLRSQRGSPEMTQDSELNL